MQLLEILNNYQNMPGDESLIHGDLKLTNILLDDKLNVFISYFGFLTIFERL